MAGLVPAIHVFVLTATKTWMPATSAGMTVCSLRDSIKPNAYRIPAPH